MKDSLLINPFINRDLSPNKTISISKINTPKNISQKIDSKSQTSSNFLYYSKNSRNNYYNKENNINGLNYIKGFFTNDIDINSNINKNLFINTIQLDKNNLRLISTRYIQNKNISLADNDKNNSEEVLSKYINSKKNRTDIVKNRFLQSQKNFYKRISNLKENNFIQNNLINFKIMLKEYKNSNSLKKKNYLLLKTNNINPKSNGNKGESTSFPSIQNSLHKTNNGKINKNNSIIYIKFKNKDIKNATLKNKSINNKVNIYSQRLKYNYENKLQKEDRNDAKKINGNNKVNNSFESKKIINDNYNKYLNDISSTDSNKSKSKDNKISSVNTKILNKILYKKMKHKAIHIKNGIFNLNKNKLNISVVENNNNKKKEKQKNIFFRDNNIKSLLSLKKQSGVSKSNPEINQNVIFNPLIGKTFS